jgi:hypothetical protein
MEIIGDLYRKMNNFEKADEYYQKAKYTKEALIEYYNRSGK